MTRSACLCLILLCGCIDVPALDERITQAAASAPYPALIDIAPLLSQAAANPAAAPGNGDLSARIAALNTRAAALRGPVIEPAIRARMLR